MTDSINWGFGDEDKSVSGFILDLANAYNYSKVTEVKEKEAENEQRKLEQVATQKKYEQTLSNPQQTIIAGVDNKTLLMGAGVGLVGLLFLLK